MLWYEMAAESSQAVDIGDCWTDSVLHGIVWLIKITIKSENMNYL